MLLGRVIGEVWATRRSPTLDGTKLLLIQPRCAYGGFAQPAPLVAADKLDAGVGDEVVVCFGAPPRWQHGGTHISIDAAVMAVVDRTEITIDDSGLALVEGSR